MTYGSIGWYALRELCDTYGLDVAWDVGGSRYKVFVWAWDWPEVGPQPLGYISLSELSEKSESEVEEFLVSCSLEAMRKGWL
jgi:hypothetical protein